MKNNYAARKGISFRNLVLLCEDPQQGIDLGIAIAAWWTERKKNQSKNSDHIITDVPCDRLVLVTLITRLTFVDPFFFDLGCTMARKTMCNGKPIGQIQRNMIARLIGLRRPKVGKSTKARDVGILLALVNAQRIGLHPTEGEKKEGNANSISGSQLVSNVLLDKYGQVNFVPSSIQRIWKRQTDILSTSGFDPKDIEDFFSRE